MTTPAYDVYGLTAAQLDWLRDKMRDKRKAAPEPVMHNLRAVEIVGDQTVDESGYRGVYEGRLISFEGGVPIRGETVWVRNPIQEISGGIPPTRMVGNRLPCRIYAAVFTEDAATASVGIGTATFPVYSVVSSQSTRYAILTDIYDGGSPIAEYSWIELAFVGPNGATGRGNMSGACRSGPMSVAVVGGNQVLSVSNTGGIYYALWDGKYLGTFNLADGAGVLATAIATITPGTTISVSGLDWTVNATGSHTLTVSASPKYAAYNLQGYFDSTKNALLVGKIVEISEGTGRLPGVIIEQLSHGRSDISSLASISFRVENVVSGEVCLTLWHTSTGESKDIILPLTGTLNDYADAFNASGFPASFSVVTGDADQGLIVTASGDYSDYGITWNQGKSTCWGDLEFVFNEPDPAPLGVLPDTSHAFALTANAGDYTWVQTIAGTQTVSYTNGAGFPETMTFVNGILSSV